MATFAKAGFNASSYAAFRPSYPPQIFNTVLAYHRGPSSLLLDLGCGHGLISRELSPRFTRVLATDPSASMIEQAAKTSSASKYSNIEFKEASAEDLSFMQDGTLDMVVAGQAAHWFDYKKVWPELSRKLRKGGTVAFWGYKDNVLPDYKEATRILDHYSYGKDTMGPYWEQPGRQILRDKYKDIVPLAEEYEDVKRITYEPGTEGPGSGEGQVLMRNKLLLGQVEGYVRTFSSYHNWKGENKDKKDIVDIMFEEMVENEPDFKKQGENWKDFEVENEWGSVILLARKK